MTSVRFEWMRRGALALAIALVTACNPASLLPTEVDRRPKLPEPEPFPIAVEDVIPPLEEAGLNCQFSPDSDIPGGWHCVRGNIAAGGSMAVTITSDETGPIEHVFAIAQFGEGGDGEPVHDQAALDARAAESFSELVIHPILPEDARPPLDVLHAVVADNFQMGVGDGYYLVFHRNIISRSMYMHYSRAE